MRPAGKDPVMEVASDSGSADEKPGVAELEKYDTAGDEIHIDPEVDKRITQKFDRRVVPWLFGLWLLAFIDRSNIGNARIDGMAKQLDLTGYTFNIALAIFYVPYILVDVPSNW